jgi:hypothetical protein
VRQGGRGKPQPWRAYTAMENHSYESSIDQLWNSIAVEGISGGSALGSASLRAMEFPSCYVLRSD